MNRARLPWAFLGIAVLGGVLWCLARWQTQKTVHAPNVDLQQESDDDRWRPSPPSRKAAFTAEIAPILGKYCVSCHQENDAAAGIVLEGFRDDRAAENAHGLWENVAKALRGGTMPPRGRVRPTPLELATLESWLDAVGGEPAGGVTVRRLNRNEYNNTLRDLFGLDLQPAKDFPADDLGDGFDNNGDVLSLPPLLFEKYLAAAEDAVEAAFRSEATRGRLLNPRDSAVPISQRNIRVPVRDHVRDRLVLSNADLPAADTADDERQRAYRILQAFADRAYRRPVTHDEVLRLLRFVEDAQRTGDGCERGIQVAMRATLCSPQFLFRMESGAAGPDRREVTEFELASRLSYFLWSSAPDEELFDHAARGTLRAKNVLTSQVRRMLRDPKSLALARNFAGQWLQIRGLKEFTPDIKRFPEFDEELRSAMAQETTLFFDAVVREDRSVLDLLNADYTFVNERLARHYGMTGIRGPEFRKVSLAGTVRGGVWTHASVLAVTSNPTRTSPVRRGKWILENFLGAAPSSPPPGVEELPEAHAGGGATLRQRMEKHRTSRKCASCHASMDPLGLGLESFDAIGAWRTADEGQPVDASGILPDGRTFEGPAGLRDILVERRGAFARCLTEKLLTYALGRGLGRDDRQTVADVARKLADNEDRFSALVLAIVHSHSFQNRRRVEGSP